MFYKSLSTVFNSLLGEVKLTEKQNKLFSSKMYFRGHHIFKKVWKPEVGVKLICKHDTREEAKLYDEFSVGIYGPVYQQLSRTSWTFAYRMIIPVV